MHVHSPSQFVTPLQGRRLFGYGTAGSGGGSVPVPVNTVAPEITFDTSPGKVGTTVTATDGTWDNSPTAYSYQWFRNSSAIGGATSSTYTLVLADADQTLYCEVTASNAGGNSLPAASNNLVPAATSAAINTASPVITQIGSGEGYISLAVDSPGTWTPGNPTSITYAYQWQSSSDNSSWSDMSGDTSTATGTTANDYYRVAIIANNGAVPSSAAYSNSIQYVP